MIPPDAQWAVAKRAGAEITELEASHSVYVSPPEAVASIKGRARRDGRRGMSREVRAIPLSGP